MNTSDPLLSFIFIFPPLVYTTIGLALFYILIQKRNTHSQNTDETILLYNHPKLLIFSCITVLMAWTCLFFVITTFLIMITGISRSTTLENFFITNLLCMVLFAILHMSTTLKIKCPLCKRRFLIQTEKNPPFSEKKLYLDGWASTVISIIQKRCFSCMYCGKKYKVTP